MYIDAHCHLDLPAFDADRAAVLDRARREGVSGFLLAGIDPVGWAAQRVLAGAEAGVAWTAGLHPVAVAEGADIEAALAALPACFEGPNAACGLGELGLDARPALKASLDRQEAAFRAQLAVARERDLPIVLHSVAAPARTLAVLKADGVPKAGGIVHAYSCGVELVNDFVGLSLGISLAGPVCSPRARKLHAVAARTPAQWLLVETDSPDQAPPEPEPGTDPQARVVPRTLVRPAATAERAVRPRNEPQRLLAIGAAVAVLRGETPHAVLARSAANLLRIFGRAGGILSPGANLRARETSAGEE